MAQRISGHEGRSLAQHWSATPSLTAFRGTTTAGFPNLSVLAGPNTALGHSSQVFMIGAQIRYIAGAVADARRRGVVRVEVRPGAQAAYDAAVRQKMKRTVWVTGGCRSWYLDATGRDVSLWPDFTWVYAYQTRHFAASSYELAMELPTVTTAAIGWPAALQFRQLPPELAFRMSQRPLPGPGHAYVRRM